MSGTYIRDYRVLIHFNRLDDSIQKLAHVGFDHLNAKAVVLSLDSTIELLRGIGESVSGVRRLGSPHSYDS